MKRTCFICSGGQIAVDPVHQQPRQRNDGVQRRAKLMRDVGEKFRLQLRSPAQIIGALIQLGIEGHHAAVGVFQLAIQQLQLFLPRCAAPAGSSAAPGSAARSPHKDSPAGAPASSGSARAPVRCVITAWCRGRCLLIRTVVPAGVASIAKSSISRRVPMIPMPMPVVDLYRPSRISSRLRIPGPESVTVTSKH